MIFLFIKFTLRFDSDMDHNARIHIPLPPMPLLTPAPSLMGASANIAVPSLNSMPKLIPRKVKQDLDHLLISNDPKSRTSQQFLSAESDKLDIYQSHSEKNVLDVCSSTDHRSLVEGVCTSVGLIYHYAYCNGNGGGEYTHFFLLYSKINR